MDLEGRGIDHERLAEAVSYHVRELSKWRLQPLCIKLGAKVGYGASCDVFLARQVSEEPWYKIIANLVMGRRIPEVPRIVVKKFRAEGDRIARLRIVNALVRELVVWSRFEHPNVLRLKGFYLDDLDYTYACAVTEWQANGNILQYLGRTELGEADLLSLIHDVASGLAYLHTLDPQVCHGDVKPDNTLVSQEKRAVLCDFGISRIIGEDSDLLTESRAITIRYASPEVMTDPGIRTLESDVWSFGCLAYRLLSNPGREPYDGLKGPGRIHSEALDEKLPGALEDLSFGDFKHIIGSCWAYAPKERPSMKLIREAIQTAIAGKFDRAVLKVLEADGIVERVPCADASYQDCRGEVQP